MKSRRPVHKTKSFQNREIENKSIKDFFTEYLKTNKHNALTDNLISYDPQIKIDYLRIFLNKLKQVFNLASSKQCQTSFSNEEKVTFESELFSNCKEIVVGLTLNIIQTESVAVRLLSIHIILCLTHFKKFHDQFQEINLSVFIVRIIDLDLTIDETALAIEYIRLLSQLYPNNINEIHFYCLISAVEDKNYLLNNFILETLLELICKRPKLACECQIFNDLINYVVNYCNENEFCIELIIQCLIKCMDNAECRQMVKLGDLFKTLLAPLIDCDYAPMLYGGSSHKNNQSENPNSEGIKIENVINSCYTALGTTLRSYTGIMCFAVNEGENLRNLLAPLSWFLKSKTKKLNKDINLNSSSFLPSSPIAQYNTKPKAEQTISRQILILNSLMNFLYKIFNIDQIDPQDLVDKAKNSRSASNVSSVSSQVFESLNEDFINSECSGLFESVENFSTASFNLNIDEEHQLKIYSTSPNLTISFKSFLIKAFVESSILESLMDLYFGLPVSFLQNYSLAKYDFKPDNLFTIYQSLSLRCLNLLAELYYWLNIKLHDEYCIDDFTQNKKNKSSPFNLNQTVYDEMKRLSLISYLKELVEQTQDFEREKEVITYLTEFNTKKELIKNGIMLPIDLLSKLSFYSQQFLVNSYYLSSKKYEIELEIFNANKSQFLPIDNKKEYKKRLTDVEKNLEEHLDLTLVLQFDLNISSNDFKYWNWFEIIRLFEIYLLTKSSMHPKFVPTQDALFIDANKTIITENQKLIKLIKRLFDFFMISSTTHESISLSSSPSKYSYSTIRPSSNSFSQPSNSNYTDLIACCGCYLIDFALQILNLKNFIDSKQNRSSRSLSHYENFFTLFIQNIKQHLINEFPIKNQTKSLNLPVNQSESNSHKTISKDSSISYYILFMGHLSSSDKGNSIMESFKLYELLLRIIEAHKHLTLIKLIVSTFNFYESPAARLILTKCLCLSPGDFLSHELREEYNDFKIYTIKLIFNIFRANNSKFDVFYIDIILNSLLISERWYTETNQSQSNSNKILLEMCLNLIEYLLNLRPEFVDSLFQLNTSTFQAIQELKNLIIFDWNNSKVLKIKIRLLAYRFQLSPNNLKILSVNEFLKIIDEWDDLKMDFKYFKLVERHLFDANAINVYFTNEFDDRNENEENIEIDYSGVKNRFKVYRRINDPAKNHTNYLAIKAQTYLPFHINKALIRYQVFLTNNFFITERFSKKIHNYLEVIKWNILNIKFNPKKNDWINGKQIKMLKAALWSICSFLICENGFKFMSVLNQEAKLFENLYDFITFIVKIVEDHPILSIRATALNCLNLVCKSSTGANLIGKLGWHTFQPNRITAEKTFNSIFSSLPYEQKKLSGIGASIDTAVELFNIYRSKSNVFLKEIKKYYYCELSTYENDYLNEAKRCNILGKNDDLDFIKVNDLKQVGYFFDNLTVPIRFTLLAVVDAMNSKDFLENKLKVIEFTDKCRFNDCFYCYLNSNDFLSSCKLLTNQNNKIKLEIINFINQLTPMINLEKKLPNLTELKRSNPSDFDLCLHCLITHKFLSCCKIKFNLRRFIQELFCKMDVNII